MINTLKHTSIVLPLPPEQNIPAWESQITVLSTRHACPCSDLPAKPLRLAWTPCPRVHLGTWGASALRFSYSPRQIKQASFSHRASSGQGGTPISLGASLMRCLLSAL